MATVPGTRKDQSAHESREKPKAEAHLPGERKVALCLLLVLLGLFALVAWLVTVAPESAGNSDFQYWMMP